MGSLATVAARAQKNLAIVIMDNGTYQITGGQQTLTEQGADIVAIARGAGLAQSAWAADEGAFEELVELALARGRAVADRLPHRPARSRRRPRNATRRASATSSCVGWG